MIIKTFGAIKNIKRFKLQNGTKMVSFKAFEGTNFSMIEDSFKELK